MAKKNRWAQQETLLNKRRRELMRRLEKIGDELDQPVDRDDDEREAGEVLEDLGTAGQRELVAIHAALIRIREGHYGICTFCDTEIPVKRLNAVPTATLCLACA